MTDKEEIIIDGVDVSGCGHLVDKDACGCMDCQSVECEKNPNCLFKQLARKTQECEELKEQLNFVRTHRIVIEAERNLYRKALEEIERVVIPLANKNLVENCWSLLDTCKKCKSKKECGNQSPYTRVKQILDIISKVKEKNQ